MKLDRELMHWLADECPRLDPSALLALQRFLERADGLDGVYFTIVSEYRSGVHPCADAEHSSIT